MVLRVCSFLLSCAGVALCSASAYSQAAQSLSSAPFDGQTSAALRERGIALLEQAAAVPAGLASTTLERYPGHSTALAARTKSSGGEMHQHFNDVFFILEGEATEIVGGTLVNRTDGEDGESRGLSVQGGQPHPMRKGDVLHISPGVPHQLLLEPGKKVVYYVVKVEQR